MGGLVKGLFGGGEKPSPPPMPAAPTKADTSVADAERDERLRRAAAGRASTMMTGGLGDTSSAPVAKKQLLGS